MRGIFGMHGMRRSVVFAAVAGLPCLGCAESLPVELENRPIITSSALSSALGGVHTPSDLSVRGHVNGEFSGSTWSGRQYWTVAASGVNGLWGGASGTMTWRADPPLSTPQPDRFIADVRCVRAQRGITADGRERLDLLVVGIPRRRLPPPFDAHAVGLEYREIGGQPTFNAQPQFLLRPEACRTNGRSFGEAVVMSGRFVIEMH